MNQKSTKPIAVVILNWNGAKLLQRYLPTVLQTTDAELADVIVADNGSTDDSQHVLAEQFPMVQTIILDQNYGFAGGYNKCLEQLPHRYTVLLNSDVRTAEGWLQPLYEFMEAHSHVACVQPKLLKDRDDDVQEFEYAGGAGGFVDRNGFPFCRGRIFDSVEQDYGQYDGDPYPIFWATGACFMVRTEVYRQLGGLDTSFFAHMEEIDLCWRMQHSGAQIYCVPKSRVYHLGGGSLPQGNPKKTYLNFRNNLLMLRKNLPEAQGRKLIFKRRLIYDTTALLVEVLKGHLANALAILKAHRDYRHMARQITQFPHADVRQRFAQCQCNIVVDYYLHRRKKF